MADVGDSIWLVGSGTNPRDQHCCVGGGLGGFKRKLGKAGKPGIESEILHSTL
jgi:hypothetical protein